jgi:DNA-binding NtrC family response regulator
MSVNLDVPFCVILAPKPCLPAPPSPLEPPVPPTPGEILPWAAAHFDFHPDPVQAEFLATPHRRVILCCHRQWGKSTVAALKAVHHALSRPGASVLVCSPTLRQSGQFLAKMLQFFFALGLKTRSHSLIPNCLVLPNGARVIVVPALVPGGQAMTPWHFGGWASRRVPSGPRDVCVPPHLHRLSMTIGTMEGQKPKVLVVDDEANQRNALASMISGWGYETRMAADGAEALSLLNDFEASAIVTDLMMPGMDGAELLRRLKDQPDPPPAIMLTAFGSLETAVEMVHDLGAFWFLEKPLQPGALRLLLQRALEQRRLRADYERLERQLSNRGVLGRLIGVSPQMQQVFLLLRQVAPTSATVLITGESGTGKELAARAIHELSPRAAGPFIAVNCAALPETLIESELFGHEKGAFTGAVERRRGCFELAEGGTLLLDEIGDMPLGTQAKLLRVIEERAVRRLGGARESPVNVRVLASTNRDLGERARRGDFREDLFFRLNVFHVELPPLRVRREDIGALCDALVPQLNKRHECHVSGLDPAALDALHAHDWPGNVRELRNALERAVILAGQGLIRREHLPRFTAQAASPEPEPALGSVHLPVGTTVDQAERALIELTLRHTSGNRTRAASILGISIKTLFNKLREYGAETQGG